MKSNPEKILVVEDGYQIRNFICHVLKSDGFSYRTAETASIAMNYLTSEQFDVVLLDLGLPDFDGMQIIKRLREWSDTPIIVVSARDQDREKAAALDAGADDYITKPFSAIELTARIRVALRHNRNKGTHKGETTATVGDLKMDFEKHLCYLNNNEVHLTPLEYRLLKYFFQNIGKVLTTKVIIKEIYGENYGDDTQALRALMASLRRKIEENTANPRYILTEIGIGYRLNDV